MINPEAIDLSALPCVALSDRKTLPLRSGIYFAIDGLNNVQYIGLSKNIQQRWLQHHRYSDLQAVDGVRIAYLAVDDVALLPAIETALIEWFQPPLNNSPVLSSVACSRDPHEKLNTRVRAGNTRRLREIAFRLGFRRIYGGIEIGSIGLMLDALASLPIEKAIAIKTLLAD